MDTAAPHADAELRISSRAEPKPEARKNRDEKNAALTKSANEMRERNAAEALGSSQETAAAPPPREDVESIEVELHDKRKVVLGPPSGVSLTMRIAMTIPDATTNPVVDKLARLLLSVRSVDGKVPIPIANIVDLTKMANVIGDVGVDELNFWYDRHWGNVRISDLQLLKKNLRG